MVNFWAKNGVFSRKNTMCRRPSAGNRGPNIIVLNPRFLGGVPGGGTSEFFPHIFAREMCKIFFCEKYFYPQPIRPFYHRWPGNSSCCANWAEPNNFLYIFINFTIIIFYLFFCTPRRAYQHQYADLTSSQTSPQIFFLKKEKKIPILSQSRTFCEMVGIIGKKFFFF